MFVDPKKLNRTSVIYSLFKNLRQDFSSNYRLALALLSPETLSSLSTAHLALFVRRMT